MKTCWCGSSNLLTFSSDYSKCNSCGTLVSLKGLAPEQLQVLDDETDFYGKKYWLNHQSQDLNFPDIHVRSRNDLTERNLHWLKTLSKYCLPPAKVLELGCSHGSFVALLNQAGYDASGVEMSPWVVEFGQKTFGVPISVGPIEALDIAFGSLDVIALMDVLEHLPDPVATMAHCLKLLKPDGLLLIQLPQFREEMKFSTLIETKSAFLEQLKADEHLYLYSDRSVTQLFQKLGANYIQFEPAIFAIYDMFLVVSRVSLVAHETDAIESALLATPDGRIALALMDLRERELDLKFKVQESEADRTARGEQIESLSLMLKESEADRTARGGQVESLSFMLKESEADRTARGEQVESLSLMLKESEADRTARGEQLESWSLMLKDSEADRSARGEQIESLSLMLKDSEADRSVRGEQIESLSLMLKESEADRSARWVQIETLTSLQNEAHANSLVLTAQIDTLTKLKLEFEVDRAVRNEEIEFLLEDLRNLFDRRGFRTLARVIAWPEVNNIKKWIGKPNE